FCFFFFQAEDGIRDDLVTGVQTCALPICLHPLSPSLVRAVHRALLETGKEGVDALERPAPAIAARGNLEVLAHAERGEDAPALRSEERRVGKGGRARGGPD